MPRKINPLRKYLLPPPFPLLRAAIDQPLLIQSCFISGIGRFDEENSVCAWKKSAKYWCLLANMHVHVGHTYIVTSNSYYLCYEFLKTRMSFIFLSSCNNFSLLKFLFACLNILKFVVKFLIYCASISAYHPSHF